MALNLFKKSEVAFEVELEWYEIDANWSGIEAEFLKLFYWDFAISDETTDLATGTVFKKTLLRAFDNISKFDFSVTTAPTGSALIFDVKKNGVSVFTTKASIDVSEKTTLTAAVPQVITGTGKISFAAGDEIEIIIDQIGSTIAGKGALVQMTYNS